MPTYPHDDSIDVNRLLFDIRNPRIPDENIAGQRQAMLRLAEMQGSKLVGLAQHIADHGLNPAQRFIVIPKGMDFVVLDGNRRLSAIKALESPAVFNTLPPARVSRLKRIQGKVGTPRAVPAVVFKDADQAEPFIRLTHLNQQSGEGLAHWSSEMKARHDERLGGKKSPALQVFDLVRVEGGLSDEAKRLSDAGKFPMTMIDRFLDARPARPILSVRVRNDVVETSLPRDQVLRPFTRIVNDIAAGRVTSRTLNTGADVAKYLGTFDSAELPDSATDTGTYASLADAPSGGAAGGKPRAAKTSRKDRPDSALREYTIPDDIDLEINSDRVHKMYLELKTGVRVHDTPNAAGVLLRTFVEMSIFLYLKRQKEPTKGSDRFSENWKAARARLLSDGTLTNKEIGAVESGLYVGSMTTLQAVAHNPDFHFSGKDLNALWGRVAPLLRAIWPPKT